MQTTETKPKPQPAPKPQRAAESLAWEVYNLYRAAVVAAGAAERSIPLTFGGLGPQSRAGFLALAEWHLGKVNGRDAAALRK